MARTSFVLVVMGTLMLFLASVSFADVPHMITYSGYVSKIHGGPLNGTFQLTFSIYADTVGSPADWTETQPEVVVKHGMFSVLLGSVNPIPPLVFDGSIKYLGVQVESDPELRPLKPIVSVAYAYRAGSAACGWTDDGTVVRLENSTDSVGIGTDAPGEKLHVVGGGFLLNTDEIGGYYCRIDGNEISGGVAGGPPGSHHLHIKPGDNSSYLLLAQDGGNVGIGTENPQERLHVIGNATIEGASTVWTDLISDPGSDAGINLTSRGVGVNTWKIMRDGASGNFLIGETLPYEPWSVDAFTIKTNGNVGIGITSPTSELEIYADEDDLVGMRITNPNTGAESSEGIYFSNEDGDVAFIRLYDDDNASYPSQMRISNNRPDGDMVLVTNNGGVGVGTAPAYELDVAGQAHASSFPVSSDARLKKNVKQLTNVLEKLEQIRGVSFDWNELYESLGRSTGHREIGVIAQEVEAVFPQLVTTWSDEEYRAVDYSRLTAVLVEAVKELKAENEALKQRIDALEGKGMSLPTGR
jgi:hypothetical protein